MLEGVVVNYDLTVRDSDNSVIQFQVSTTPEKSAVDPDPVEPGHFWPGRIRVFFDVKICKV
jgi:hypothetical protein